MFFKKVWVKSHLIEEGAYNKNYCPEPTVSSKRSKPDPHLIKAFFCQKNSKEDNYVSLKIIENVIKKKEIGLNKNGLNI